MSCCRPLFERKPNIDQCFPAYITISSKGKIYQNVAYNDGCCEREFNGYQESFKVPESLTQAQLDELIEKIRPLGKQLFEGKKDIGQRMVDKDGSRCDAIRREIECLIDSVEPDFDLCEDPECEYCNEE